MIPLDAIERMSGGAVRTVLYVLTAQNEGVIMTPEAVGTRLGLNPNTVRAHLREAKKLGLRENEDGLYTWEKQERKRPNVEGYSPRVMKAIKLYRGIVKRYPPKEAWEEIADALDGVDWRRAREAYAQWVARGLSPHNYEWVHTCKGKRHDDIFRGIMR